jgi:two-component system, OmpR family, response regulator
MSGFKYKIFIVDDDKMLLSALKHTLSANKTLDIFIFSTGEECLKEMGRNPDIVILDYYLNSKYPDAINGIETLKKIKQLAPKTRVIMLSAQDNVAITKDTISNGAYDYVQKGESAFLKVENMVRNITSTMILKEDYEKGVNIYNKIHILIIIVFILLFILSLIF